MVFIWDLNVRALLCYTHICIVIAGGLKCFWWFELYEISIDKDAYDPLEKRHS